MRTIDCWGSVQEPSSLFTYLTEKRADSGRFTVDFFRLFGRLFLQVDTVKVAGKNRKQPNPPAAAERRFTSWRACRFCCCCVCLGGGFAQGARRTSTLPPPLPPSTRTKNTTAAAKRKIRKRERDGQKRQATKKKTKTRVFRWKWSRNERPTAPRLLAAIVKNRHCISNSWFRWEMHIHSSYRRFLNDG